MLNTLCRIVPVLAALLLIQPAQAISPEKHWTRRQVNAMEKLEVFAPSTAEEAARPPHGSKQFYASMGTANMGAPGGLVGGALGELAAAAHAYEKDPYVDDKFHRAFLKEEAAHLDALKAIPDPSPAKLIAPITYQVVKADPTLGAGVVEKGGASFGTTVTIHGLIRINDNDNSRAQLGYRIRGKITILNARRTERLYSGFIDGRSTLGFTADQIVADPTLLDQLKADAARVYGEELAKRLAEKGEPHVERKQKK